MEDQSHLTNPVVSKNDRSKNINFQVPEIVVTGEEIGAVAATGQGDYASRTLLPTPDSPFIEAIQRHSPERNDRRQSLILSTSNVGPISIQPIGVSNIPSQASSWPGSFGKKHFKVKKEVTKPPTFLAATNTGTIKKTYTQSPEKARSPVASHSKSRAQMEGSVLQYGPANAPSGIIELGSTGTSQVAWSTGGDTEPQLPTISSGQEKVQHTQNIPQIQYGPPGPSGHPVQPSHFQHTQTEQYIQHSQHYQGGQFIQRGQHIPHTQPVGQFGHYNQPGQHVQPVKTGQHMPHGQYGPQGPPGRHGQHVQHGQHIQHSQPRQYGQFNPRAQPSQHGHGQPSMQGQHAAYTQQAQPVQQGQNNQQINQHVQQGQQGQHGQHGQHTQHGQQGQHGQRGQHGKHGQSGQPGQSGQSGQPGQHGQLVSFSQHNQYAQSGNFGQQGQQAQYTSYTQHTPHGQPAHPELGQHGQFGPPGQFIQQIQYAQKNSGQLGTHNQNLQQQQQQQHVQQLGQFSQHQQFGPHLQFGQYVAPNQLTQHAQQQPPIDSVSQQGQRIQQFSHHGQQSQSQPTHHVQFGQHVQEEQHSQSIQQNPQVVQIPEQDQIVQLAQLAQEAQHSQRSHAELTQNQQVQMHLTQLSQYSQHEQITQNIQQLSHLSQLSQIDQQVQQTQQQQQILPAQGTLIQLDQIVQQLVQQDQNVQKTPSQHGQLIQQTHQTAPQFSQANPEYIEQFPQESQLKPQDEFAHHIQKLAELGNQDQPVSEGPAHPDNQIMIETELLPDNQDDQLVRQIQKLEQLALHSPDQFAESVGKEEFDRDFENTDQFDQPINQTQIDQLTQHAQKPVQLDHSSFEKYYTKHDIQQIQRRQEAQSTIHLSIEDTSKSKISSYAEILRSEDLEAKDQQTARGTTSGPKNLYVSEFPKIAQKPSKPISSGKHPQQFQQEHYRLEKTKTDMRIGFRPISHVLEVPTSLDFQLPPKPEQTSVSKSPFEIATSFDEPPSVGEILQLHLNEMFGNNAGNNTQQGATKKDKKHTKSFRDWKNTAAVGGTEDKPFNKDFEIQKLLKLLRINETSIGTLSNTKIIYAPPGFPHLTATQQAIITAAVNVNNEIETEVLITKYEYKITRADIRTLKDDEWLNSQIINFYMSLIVERNAKQRHSQGMLKVYAMNSYFLNNLMQSGFISVQRWTQKVDIFSYDAILIPLHYKAHQHWSLVVIHFKDLYIQIFDSTNYYNEEALEAVSEYLRAESQDKRHVPFDTRPFHTNIAKHIPQQENGNDSGVFCCLYADYISRNKQMTFLSRNIKYFRRKIAMEILLGELLYSS